MIAPETYENLGELLLDCFTTYKTETALIEANRKRETERLSYLEVKQQAQKQAGRLKELGIDAGDRVAIVMSNQSKWLISATAVFFRGGVLVPIDYKLTAPEQLALIQHSSAKVLFTEFQMQNDMHAENTCKVIVTDVPEAAELQPNVLRWDDVEIHETSAVVVPRNRQDVATIVYSSGTGGKPKGCMLTHENYLEQCFTLTSLFPLLIGDRYFSILPTNHAIDFMCGFVGPFTGGATVVHQRTLRPEFINDSLKRFQITHMALVPLILEAFETRIREQIDEKNDWAKSAIDTLMQINASITMRKPKHDLSKRLLKPIHDAFGGHLKFMFCGGAFVDSARAQYFYDLGLPVVIGYGLTEACTVLTVNDLKPFRADSVGGPLPGVEIEIRNIDPNNGIGEVWVKSKTVMKGYLDDPEQTAEVLQDGWLRTGDLGKLDASDHLRLVGRSKNMIVTAGGKNIYPEDIENAFVDMPCEEMVVFAANYVWPDGKLEDERLIAVVRGMDTQNAIAEVRQRNRGLPDFKRISGVLAWDEPFPRTASMKIKRPLLAEGLREAANAAEVVRA